MNNKKIIAAGLCLTIFAGMGMPAMAEGELAETQILSNSGFEAFDSKGFPAGWDSNGKDLFVNGDFEGDMLNCGQALTGNTIKWEERQGSATVSAVPADSNDTSANGSKKAKLQWNAAKWGGIGYQLSSNTANNLFAVAWNQDYIFRGYTRAAEDSLSSFTNENFIGYFAYYKTAADTKLTEIKPKCTGKTSAEWTEHYATVNFGAKPDGGFDIPHLTRSGFRYMSAPVFNESGTANLYMDNLSLEKLGRTTDAQAYSGNRSLKIVGYADGEDETWSSGAASVKAGEQITLSAVIKTEGLADYSLNGGNDLRSANLYAFAEYDTGDCVDIAYVTEQNSGWTKYSAASTVPDGASSVSIVFVLGGTGTVYIDDAEVTAMRSTQESSINIDDYKNLFAYGDIETVDKYKFPVGWMSNGMDLFDGGDFESESVLVSGGIQNAVSGDKLRWCADASGSATTLSIVPTEENEAEAYGSSKAKVAWTEERKWGGAGYNRLDKRYDKNYFMTAWDSDYIFRASYKVGAGTFDGTALYPYFLYSKTTDTFAEMQRIDSQRPTEEWTDYAWTVNFGAKPEGGLDNPGISRMSLRYNAESTPLFDINGEAYMYFDNIRFEKLGRADSNAYEGSNSLKIVAYDDGIDEEWVTDKVGISGESQIMISQMGTTVNADKGIDVYAVFYNGDSVMQSVPVYTNLSDSSWKRRSMLVDVPENADGVSVKYAFGAKSGTAYIDDVIIGTESSRPFIKDIEYMYDWTDSLTALDGVVCGELELTVWVDGIDQERALDIITVVYDAGGNIAGIGKAEQTSFSASGEATAADVYITLSEDCSFDLTGCSIKTFLWSSKMRPYDLRMF